MQEGHKSGCSDERSAWPVVYQVNAALALSQRMSTKTNHLIVTAAPADNTEISAATTEPPWASVSGADIGE
jgi:hypothetical protein